MNVLFRVLFLLNNIPLAVSATTFLKSGKIYFKFLWWEKLLEVLHHYTEI